jgi:hypothetical protein
VFTIFISLLYKKSDVNDFNKQNTMLEIVNNRIFVDGVENNQSGTYRLGTIRFRSKPGERWYEDRFKDQDVFVESLITEL